MINFYRKKVKHLHNYSPAAIGTAFTTKFAIDAKVPKSAFRDISYLGFDFN